MESQPQNTKFRNNPENFHQMATHRVPMEDPDQTVRICQLVPFAGHAYITQHSELPKRTRSQYSCMNTYAHSCLIPNTIDK